VANVPAAAALALVDSQQAVMGLALVEQLSHRPKRMVFCPVADLPAFTDFLHHTPVSAAFGWELLESGLCQRLADMEKRAS
jgi:hypothetical protein